MIQNKENSEILGHTRAVHEELCFADSLSQSVSRMPHTEGRSPWGRIDVADDDPPAVAVLADPDLPPFLITDFNV